MAVTAPYDHDLPVSHLLPPSSSFPLYLPSWQLSVFVGWNAVLSHSRCLFPFVQVSVDVISLSGFLPIECKRSTPATLNRPPHCVSFIYVPFLKHSCIGLLYSTSVHQNVSSMEAEKEPGLVHSQLYP